MASTRHKTPEMGATLFSCQLVVLVVLSAPPFLCAEKSHVFLFKLQQAVKKKEHMRNAFENKFVVLTNASFEDTSFEETSCNSDGNDIEKVRVRFCFAFFSILFCIWSFIVFARTPL